jgi:hypothetical protein
MRIALLLAVGCTTHVTNEIIDSPAADAGHDTCANPTAFWIDADHDGFGSALESPKMACAAPLGYVGNNRDCGDGDDRMRPNQTVAQLGPASGKTSGSPFDFNCDGKDVPMNLDQGDCVLNMANMCVYTPGFALPQTIKICAEQYGRISRCGTSMTSACEARIEEMRYPDCL